MKPEDDKLVDDVANALFNVREANVLKASQTLTFGDEKYVEASVILTRDTIRSETGRDKLRDVVIDDIQDKFQRKYGLEVTRMPDDKLMVKTVPMQHESNFQSLDNLFSGADRAKKYVDEYNSDEE